MLIFEETETEKLSLIRKAIEKKVEISFWYKGVKFRNPNNKVYTKQNWRFAQPTDLGISNASRKWMLRAFQDTGVTNTKKPAWKTFLVDEMSSITVMDGEDGNYKPFTEPGQFEKFNKTGDKHMVNGRPELKIKLGNEPIAKPIEKPIEPAKENEPEINNNMEPKTPKKNSIIPEPEKALEVKPEKELGVNPEDEIEIDKEPIKESSGFFNWIINL